MDHPEPKKAWAAMKLIGKTTANASTLVIISVNDFESVCIRVLSPLF